MRGYTLILTGLLALCLTVPTAFSAETLKGLTGTVAVTAHY